MYDHDIAKTLVRVAAWTAARIKEERSEGALDVDNRPKDRHKETAAKLFDVRYDDVTADQREAAKQYVFAEAYQGTPETLQQLVEGTNNKP